MAKRLKFYFKREARQLRVTHTEFWDQSNAPKPTTTVVLEASDSKDRPKDSNSRATFPWTPGVRAMAALFLWHFSPDGAGSVLRGDNSSLACSLYEVLRRHAREESWIQRIFPPGKPSTGKDKSGRTFDRCLPLSTKLFERTGDNKKHQYEVRLGSDWIDAKFEAEENGVPLASSEFKRLARELDPLQGSIDVLVRRSADEEWHSLTTKPKLQSNSPNQSAPLLALKPRDMLRVRVRLNRKAFVHVVWFFPDGRAEPAFPWKPGRWHDFVNVPAVSDLTIPADKPKEWAAGEWVWGEFEWGVKGEAGVETFVLAASSENPIAQCLENMFSIAVSELREVPTGCNDFKYERPLADEATGESATKPHRRRTANWHRAPRVDPVKKRHDDLIARFQANRCVEFACGISVPSEGGDAPKNQP